MVFSPGNLRNPQIEFRPLQNKTQMTMSSASGTARIAKNVVHRKLGNILRTLGRMTVVQPKNAAPLQKLFLIELSKHLYIMQG